MLLSLRKNGLTSLFKEVRVFKAVEMPRPGAPSPKGPPASPMPTPEEVHQMSSSSPAVDPEDTISGRGRYRTIRSSTDIDWSRSLEVQLEPDLKGGPDPSKSDPSRNCVYFAGRSLDCPIAPSIRSIPVTM